MACFCSLIHITLQWTIANFGLTMVKIGAFLPSNEVSWKGKKKKIRNQYETRRHCSAAAPPLPVLFKKINPQKHFSRLLHTPTGSVTLKWPTQYNAEAGAVLQGCGHKASGCLIGRGSWKTKRSTHRALRTGADALCASSLSWTGQLPKQKLCMKNPDSKIHLQMDGLLTCTSNNVLRTFQTLKINSWARNTTLTYKNIKIHTITSLSTV